MIVGERAVNQLSLLRDRRRKASFVENEEEEIVLRLEKEHETQKDTGDDKASEADARVSIKGRRRQQRGLLSPKSRK